MSETIENPKIVEPVKLDKRRAPRSDAQLAVLVKARLKASATIQARVKAKQNVELKEPIPEPIIVPEVKPDPIPEPVIVPEVKPDPIPQPVPQPIPQSKPDPIPQPKSEPGHTLFFSRKPKEMLDGVPKKEKYRYDDGIWFKN